MSDAMLKRVGNTPLIELEEEIFAKLESMNPSGSIKDRMVKHILEEAEKKGELKKGCEVVEATSGNTGISLSMIGMLKGYKVKIFMPHYMSEERKRMIKYFGAKLFLTGSMQEAVENAEKEAKKSNVFLLNQFNNPENINAHYLGTGREIVKQIGKRIDFFAAGIGTGGTVMGTGKAIKEKHPNAKVVGVIPQNPEKNKIEGIGCYYSNKMVDEDFLDEVIKISNKKAIKETRHLAKKFGLFVGISSGANYAAAKRFKGIKSTVLADSANRYLSTELFKEE